LQNVGIIKAAYDFGSTPPLEGGGIFQVGLEYEAGSKVRVHPRITVRADFWETLSKNLRFIQKGYNTTLKSSRWIPVRSTGSSGFRWVRRSPSSADIPKIDLLTRAG
jgi:hypothetical protein